MNTRISRVQELFQGRYNQESRRVDALRAEIRELEVRVLELEAQLRLESAGVDLALAALREAAGRLAAIGEEDA